MFTDLQSSNFGHTASGSTLGGFMAINTPKFGETDTWGYILNTDETGLRQTQLWKNTRVYKTITLSLIEATTNEDSDSFNFDLITNATAKTSYRLSDLVY